MRNNQLKVEKNFAERREKIVASLSVYLEHAEPELKGFSSQY
jgi:hypothetical protein